MLKRIDYYFFGGQGTIKDRIYFYGTLAFLFGVSLFAIMVAKL